MTAIVTARSRPASLAKVAKVPPSGKAAERTRQAVPAKQGKEAKRAKDTMGKRPTTVPPSSSRRQPREAEFCARVGAALRYFRSLKAWSQRELAQSAQLSVNFLARVERAEVALSLWSAMCLCEALGIDLNMLAKGDPLPPPLTRVGKSPSYRPTTRPAVLGPKRDTMVPKRA